MVALTTFVCALAVSAPPSLAIDLQAPPAPQDPSAVDTGLPIGATELPDLRTQTSLSYAAPDGSEITRFFEGPVNFRDSTGSWQPIDNSLVPTFSPGYAYRNAANSYVAELPQDLSGPVRFALGDDAITMALEGAQGTGTVTQNRDTFAGVLPGVSVDYVAGNEALKEALTLSGPGVQSSFRFKITTSAGVSARKDGSGDVDFEKDGRVLFSLAAPILEDATRSPRSVSTAVELQLESLSDGYRVTLTPDAGWLSDPSRTWPVVLDPTIELHTNGECAIYRSGNPARRCLVPNYSYDDVGSHGTDSSIARSLFRFDLTSIPNDAKVTAATFSTYVGYLPNAYASIQLHRLTRDWTSGVSWNTSDGATAWTQPGGDFNVVPEDPTVLVTPTTTDPRQRWNVRNLVQDWVSGASKNYGLILKTLETPGVDDYTYFYSSTFGAFNPSMWSQYWPVLGVQWNAQGRYTSTPSSNSWVVDGGSGDTPRVNAIKANGNTVYVGGDFSMVGPRTGSFASLKASDAGYEPGTPEVAGTAGTPSGGTVPVRAIAPDGAGGWFIGGDFKYVGGQRHDRLAHIRLDGTLDQTWDPAPNGDVYALVVSGSSLYVGGQFTAIGGRAQRAIAKLDAASGTIDPYWNPGVDDGSVRAIALGGLGAMYIGGTFTSLRGGAYPRARLAGLDPASGFPLSLSVPVDDGAIYALTVAGGNLYLGGSFSHVAGSPRNHLAAIALGSQAIASWDGAGGTSADVYALTADSSKLYVGGAFFNVGSLNHVGLARFTLATGALDSWYSNVYNDDGATSVKALALSGPTLYAGGYFSSHYNIEAVDTTSTTGQVTSWNPRVGNGVYAIGLCTGSVCQGGVDHVAVGGAFRTVNASPRHDLAAVYADTGQVTWWRADATSEVMALELARGRLYVGGNFSLGGCARLVYFVLSSGGGQRNAWCPELSGAVHGLLATGDRLYVGTDARSGPNRQYAVAYNLDSDTEVTDWQPNPNGPVTTFETDGDAIFMAGSFTALGGPWWSNGTTPRNGLASVYRSGLGAQSGAITGWNPNPNGAVTSLAVAKGRIYVGGDFDSIGGAAQARLAAFSSAGGGGALDQGWMPAGVDRRVDALAADGGGVYVGGRFSQIDDQPRPGLAAIDPAKGGVLLPFNPAPETGPATQGAPAGGSGSVRALEITNSILWAGGDWYAVGSHGQAGLASFAGYGYLTEPAEGTRTRKRLTLRAATGTSLYNRVRFEYRRANDKDTWETIPLANVTDTNNQSLGTWPLSLSNGVSPTVVWDMPPTKGTAPNVGINFQNGDVAVRAVFIEPSGQEYASDLVKVTLDQDSPGQGDAGTPLGPGSLDLLSGNFRISRDDVAESGSVSDLTLTRTFNSRNPASDGPLGPGWLTSLPVDAAGSNYVSLKTETIDDGDQSYEVVTLTDSDGGQFTFVYFEGQYWPDAGAEDLTLTRSGPSEYSLTDADGNVTVFRPDGSGDPSSYSPAEIRQPGVDNTTTFDYQPYGGKSRIFHILAAGSLHTGETSAVCLGSSAPARCRYLTFNYAAASPPTPGDTPSTWGDYANRLTSVDLTTVDSQHNKTQTTMVSYKYDSKGYLREAVDNPTADAATQTPPLFETYSYDSQNHLATLTPPGEVPWTFTYAAIPSDPNTGRLRTVERKDPNWPTARTTVLYQVPLSGQYAPYPMSQSDVAKWGQQDIPTDATAIFPPNREPNAPASQPVQLLPVSEYHYAAVHYLDRFAREVNTSSPGSDSRGFIATTEWDDHDNVVRSLSAANRLTALGSSDSVGTSRSLDTQRAYSADGVDLQTELGPLHWVQVGSQYMQNRKLTTYTYDQGVPAGTGPLHLLTTATERTYQWNGETDDARTTTYGYFDQGTDMGVTLRKPTSITVAAGNLNLKTSIRYNDKGLATSRTTPAGSSGLNDAHTTQTIYYTAGANSQDSVCGNHEEWLNMPCETRTAAAPTPSDPGTAATLPQPVFEYNRLYEVNKRTDTVGTHSRVTTTGYDTAGRVRSQTVTAPGEGATVPDTATTYDSATGQPANTTSSAGTMKRTYDALGRIATYEDADHGLTKTTYDGYGRLTDVATWRDASDASTYIGGQTYSYDQVSGLVSDLRDSAVGDFQATAYNADGQLTSELYPNGLTATTAYDQTGDAVGLTYAKQGNVWLNFSVKQSIHGQWTSQTSTLGNTDYTYDQAGRLHQVNDTAQGQPCTTHTYGYDGDSNRRTEDSQPCGGGSTATTTYAYDSGDRLIGSGVSTDDFGRITALPGQYADGNPNDQLTSDYYANDSVHSQTLRRQGQPDLTNTYDLDPLNRQRRRTQQTGTPPTASTTTDVYHYGGDSDSPSWIASSANGTTWNWTRNIPDISGGLAGTQKSDGSTELDLANLHGDLVATCSASTTATGVTKTFSADEFGVPRQPDSPTYSWLGAKNRRTELPDGVVQMGARSYVPSIGRFLQPDPVAGGSANSYDYADQDPLNSYDLDGRQVAIPKIKGTCNVNFINSVARVRVHGRIRYQAHSRTNVSCVPGIKVELFMELYEERKSNPGGFDPVKFKGPRYGAGAAHISLTARAAPERRYQAITYINIELPPNTAFVTAPKGCTRVGNVLACVALPGPFRFKGL